MTHSFLTMVRDMVWSIPFLSFIVAVGCIVTVALNFIQVRNFCKSWRLVLGGPDENPKTGAGRKGDMSPFQAFLNALSVSVGNGSLAGIGAAIYLGGPGVAFWMFLIGFLCMAIRFAEVFLGVSFALMNSNKGSSLLGGPFLYIKELPFGSILATLYAASCLFYGVVSGCAMQCNSISTSVHDVTGISTYIVGVILFALVLYIMFGGAKRIVIVSEAMVPIKVGLFFSTMIIVLAYHWANLIPSIVLICKSAFNPSAAAGAVVGLTVQRLFALSARRTINATEAGLGTAAIFYSNTASDKPINDGTTSMLSTFIGNNIVNTMVALAIVASGVWDKGHDGAVAVVAAYQTVFGAPGGWIVAILSITFGIGVFVAYGYVTRQCWLYLTNDRYESVFCFIFASIAFFGSIAQIQMVWTIVDLAVAFCLLLNLTAILYFIPYMRAHVLGNE
ncbi:MAG: AGCS family alanine or glycine:cation symporter [Alteromonas naphthalenivorans]|jgi:AGCS family alanine or glycine:cation symporter